MLTINQFYPILAAGGIAAPNVVGWISNSIIVAVIVTFLIIVFMRIATKNIQTIPDGKQNFVEFIIEFLYNQLESIVGKKVAPKAFPLLATIFIFVITANWFGLIPGIGTIGWGENIAPLSLKTVQTPLLRPATADLNMTLALSVVFMVVWFWITIREMGVWGTITHMFGPKGGLTGIMKYLLAPLFMMVGVIELVSIAFRPMSLSLRLLGNVYAGETLLVTMGNLGDMIGAKGLLSFISSIIVPLPFYFLEILVGALQAMVFTILCAVYIKLSTTHDEAHSDH